MRTIYFFLCSLFVGILNAQIINFSDVELKNRLLDANPSTYIAKDSDGSAVAIDTNMDNEIDIAEAQAIYQLDISSSNISDLTGLENFINLTRLEINLNTISNFDGTAFTNLEYLDFSNNLLTAVDVTGLTNLEILWAHGNPYTSIDLSSLSGLGLLDISYCDNLLALNVSNLGNLTDLRCNSNDAMESLNVNGCAALEDLNCQYSALTSLDLSGLPNLDTMFAENNNITSIDVTGAISLGNINIAYNQVTSLTVHDLPVLQSISANGNLINNFDIQNCPFFFTLVMEDNELTTLDLSNVPSTVIVEVANNNINELVLADNNELYQIGLSNNQLTELNLNNCVNFNWGSFDNNPNLESILIKNGSMESLFNIDIDNLPNLQYVCADDEQLNLVQAWLTNNGYNTVNVNTYCSFTPGGVFYEIQGQVQYDFDNDGCSITDPMVPFMNYNISDGVEMAMGVADSTGIYRIPVQEGSYTITPNTIDPALFNVTPSSFTVDFPQDASPMIQDICIVPSSTVNDLAVVITPLTPARPGFDADYQLMVKNVGNQILSGEVSLEYPENLMAFMESDVPFDTSTSNSYTWNFTDLVPFQSVSVRATFTVNTPTDPSFPVNIDDILTFTSNVNPIEGDINTENNGFTIDQTVVGSFDPNDILCLEGESITTDDVGKDVHYRIRFENTGTFPAENIVIQNTINSQKFDVSSLEVLNGSHEFITRITGDSVEFLFENINLPFDDANNDGFILYSIKTLSTLNEGDTFSNMANIYFDYNFPIQTNTFSTVVMDNLSVDELDQNNTLTLFPNPAINDLNFSSEHDIQRIQVFNVLGKMINELHGEPSINQLNVLNLSKGVYFINFKINDKTYTRKFIKS